MASIAALLKSEITRLARKEVRTEVVSLRKTSTAHRAEIATLKRRLVALEQLANRAGRAAPRAAASAGDGESATVEDSRTRFSAKSMRSQRRRLGLSASQIGLLVGSSAQSVYNWEEGKTRPQARHLKAIVELRALGRREVTKRLQSLGEKAA